MAVTLDNSASLSYSTSASRSTSFTCSGSNRLLVVTIQTRGDSSHVSVSSVTYNGVALTNQVAINETGFGVCRVEIWTLIAPATGSNTLQINWGAGSIARNSVIISSYNGVNQTTPVSDSDSTQGDADTFSLSLTLPSGGLIVDSAFSLINSPGSSQLTVQSGQTLIANVGQSTDTDTSGSSYKTSSGTVGWDTSGTAIFAYCAIAIDQSTGGASGKPDQYYRMMRG